MKDNNSMEFKTYTYPLIQNHMFTCGLGAHFTVGSPRICFCVRQQLLSFSALNVRAWPSTACVVFIFKIILIKSVIESIKSKTI